MSLVSCVPGHVFVSLLHLITHSKTQDPGLETRHKTRARSPRAVSGSLRVQHYKE
jgi:hypothetical protein